MKHYRRIAVIAVAALLLAFVATRFRNELHRLILDPSSLGALDLMCLHEDARDWRDGLYVYDHPVHADYPPPTFPVIWSCVGWLEPAAARWVWAGLSLLCLAGLSWLLVQISGVAGSDVRLLVGLFPFASYSAANIVGNGQLTHIVLALVVLALWLESRHPPSTARDLLVALIFSLGLLKPSVTAPFFWLLAFTPDRRSAMAALLTVGVYGALTLVAAAWQPVSALELLAGWTVGAMTGVQQASDTGNPNLASLLYLLELNPKTLLPSLLLLGAAGVWSWLYRSAHLSLRLGVVAVVAWFWTYHRSYDDLLLVLPLAGLLVIARAHGWSSRAGRSASVLLVMGALLLIRPMGWHLPAAIHTALIIGSGLLWLIVAGYLIAIARRRDES